MADKIFKQFQFFGKKLVCKGFYGRWLRICCQICKFQNGESNMADKIF